MLLKIEFSSHLVQQHIFSKRLEFCLLTKIGLCSTKNGIHTKIVLSGDPKQLDAICKSTVTTKLGYNISLMQRLFELPLYTPGEAKKFNSKYITQLVKNYRSHIAILCIANALFYNNSLISQAPKGKLHRRNKNI